MVAFLPIIVGNGSDGWWSAGRWCCRFDLEDVTAEMLWNRSGRRAWLFPRVQYPYQLLSAAGITPLAHTCRLQQSNLEPNFKACDARTVAIPPIAIPPIDHHISRHLGARVTLSTRSLVLSLSQQKGSYTTLPATPSLEPWHFLPSQRPTRHLACRLHLAPPSAPWPTTP